MEPAVARNEDEEQGDDDCRIPCIICLDAVD